MVHTFTKNITQIIDLLPFVLVSALVLPISAMAEPGMLPISAMAEPGMLPCTDAHLQIKQTQTILQPMKQRQQQLQQDVRIIYQKLFACKTGTALSIAEQQYCSQLQEEGPKQFQAMVEAITLSHQTSQQLTNQTHQVHLNCPTISKDTYSEITSLTSLQKLATN